MLTEIINENQITFWEKNWVQGSFFDKAFLVFAAMMLFLAAIFAFQHFKNNPKKRLGFIARAQKDGCLVVGRLTCFTVHGIGRPEKLHAEYMYVVDDKKYFVTYEMKYSLSPDRDDQNNVDPDMLLEKIKPALILFFNKDNPTKVMSKFEVFTSYDAIHQIDTPKDNVWRDVEKDWSEPIMLIRY